jgi:AraC-like DNA-binding protein
MMCFEELRSSILAHCGHYVSFPLAGKRCEAGDFRIRRKFGIDIAEIDCRIDRIDRGRDGIRRDDAEFLFLVVQRAGRTVVTHQGRQETLHPGDSLIVDSTKPAELLYRGRASSFISVHLPRGLCLEGRARGPATARRVAATHPLQASLGSLLAAAPADDVPDDYIFDFVALMFRPDPASRETPGFRDRFARYAWISATLDRHVADPELTVDRLAALVHMSRRQLQRDLADNGTSFTRLLAERRVKLTTDQLRRAAHRGERPAIAEIAYRVGFNDLSHFNRVFRSHTDQSPRDYYATHAAASR